MNIPIFNTYINPDAHVLVKEVLDTTFLSEGKLVQEFELHLSKQLHISNPITVNSGTSALHLALVLAGIGEGDEVIIPAQTFIATGLVVVQQKAVPIFADIDYETGNISVKSIQNKITERTKAIIPVHWAGYPCDMDEIIQLGKEHNIAIIEDAAHALGASYKGKAIGSISDFTCFSFQAIKHITTGDGGAVACFTESHARDAVCKRWFGIDRHNSVPSILGERQYNVPSLGFKYHMNDYSAALGIANLIGFRKRLEQRRAFAKAYNNELSKVTGIKLFDYAPDRQSAFWLYGFHVERREDFINALKAKGITASVVHQRIDRNSVFGNVREDLVDQQKFDRTQIHIPLHDALDDEKVRYIIESIRQGW